MCCPGVSPIITFDEFINIALNAKRVVGIYPEMKSPVFINQHVRHEHTTKLENFSLNPGSIVNSP